MKGLFRDASGPLAKFGVVVIDDAITDEFRRRLLEHVMSADSVPALVVGSGEGRADAPTVGSGASSDPSSGPSSDQSSDPSSGPSSGASTTPGVDVRVRRTRQLTVGRRVADELDTYFASIAPEVAAATRRAVATAEPVSCLRYGPGDFFVAHRDSPVGAGAREVDRRLVSVVLFVNGRTSETSETSETGETGESGATVPTFTGGELVLVPVEDFVDFGVAVDPVPGRLVLFPSTMVHEVKAVASGDRFTVVTWYHA